VIHGLILAQAWRSGEASGIPLALSPRSNEETTHGASVYLAMTSAWDLIQRRIEAYYGRAFILCPAAGGELARNAR